MRLYTHTHTHTEYYYCLNKRDNNVCYVKSDTGITLVALVITIIVLLILAGVSLGLVFNSEGLFEKANTAASKYNQSKEDELAYLQGTEEDLNKYNGIYVEGTGTSNPSTTVTPTPEPTPVLPAKGEEPPEAGWTVEEAKGLVARDGLREHLGEKVAYSPTEDETGVYRIFYYDNEPNSEDPSKGYFGDAINTLYLKRDYVGNDTTLTNYTTYTPSDSGAIMKRMNPKWAASTNSSSIDLENEHCVAWLCDASQWTKYKVDNVANYVIGSSSVEMYMKAFNVYKDNNANSTTLINKIGNINGYNLGEQNSYTWNGSNEYYTGDNSIEPGPNNIFITSGKKYLWLASPSAKGSNQIINVSGDEAFVVANSHSLALGVCPIVSISQ